MALSRASRSASLSSSPAATCATRPRVVAVGGRQLGDALAGSADPLGLATGVVGQQLLAADHRRQVDRERRSARTAAAGRRGGARGRAGRRRRLIWRPALGHVGVRRGGEQRQHRSTGQDGGAAGPSSVGRRERGGLTCVVTSRRVSPYWRACLTPSSPRSSRDRGLRERDQPPHDLLEHDEQTSAPGSCEQTGNEHGSPPSTDWIVGKPSALAGTDPHRTARPVAAPPPHRPRRQARRGRRAAQPPQPRDHRRQDGRRAQPHARTPATPAACNARPRWARCSRASSAASSSPSSR